MMSDKIEELNEEELISMAILMNKRKAMRLKLNLKGAFLVLKE
jgi:hypothetical protein